MVTGIYVQREKNVLRRIFEVHLTPNHDDQDVGAGQGQGSLKRLEHRDRAQPAFVGVRVLGMPKVGSGGDAVHALSNFDDGACTR